VTAGPITGSDAEIRAAVADAELPPLLAALAHLTGEPLPARLRPPTISRTVAQGGYSDRQQAEARGLAAGLLMAIRDGQAPVRPVLADPAAAGRAAAGPLVADPVATGLAATGPVVTGPAATDPVVADPVVADPGGAGPAGLLETVRFLVGDMAERYLPLLLDELAARSGGGAPGWQLDQVAPGREFRVVIIGAGMSGLLAAYRLGQAGIPYTIIEKNADVGGTWLENTYPGCRVDVSNHLYSYSFWPRDDWPGYFSTGDVLLGYFRAFAAEHGIREHIRFESEVTDLTFDEATCTWSVTARRPDGTAARITAQAVISAVGQLNRPRYPDIAGRDGFTGPAFHSARWDHEADLRGRRVAVIGTGASAFQFVPEIAGEADQLTVFQRTAPWLGPTPTYHDPVASGLQWLLANLPGYAQWYRFWLFCSSVEGGLPNVAVDPDWPVSERSVSALNDQLRADLTSYLELLYAGRTDLLTAAVPDYPPGAKRMLRDNGVWSAALRRDNVRLVTDPIDRITASGVVTADGAEHPADVLIYATGFTASEFLTPMTVTGRGGARLPEAWAGDARAYLGITVPGFPNLFCVYGPNTNIVINGSIIFFSECAVHYITGCIEALLAGGHRAADIRAGVHDAYNEMIDAGNRRQAWGVSAVSTWYKNALGRVSQNWPYTLMEYWERTRAPDLSDYELL
jgi:4-hydroxyacetophenone monooxygenase